MPLDKHLRHSTGEQPHHDDRARKLASYRRGTEAAEQQRQEREQEEARER